MEIHCPRTYEKGIDIHVVGAGGSTGSPIFVIVVPAADGTGTGSTKIYATSGEDVIFERKISAKAAIDSNGIRARTPCITSIVVVL
jgi:hypothetical protein